MPAKVVAQPDYDVSALLGLLEAATGDDLTGGGPETTLSRFIDANRAPGWYRDVLGHFSYTVVYAGDALPSVPHASVTVVEITNGIVAVITATLDGWLAYYDATKNDEVGAAFEAVGVGDLFYKRELTCLA